jgi:MoxR-like ATPase
MDFSRSDNSRPERPWDSEDGQTGGVEPENRAEPEDEIEPESGAEPQNEPEPENRAEPEDKIEPEDRIEPGNGAEPEDEIEPESRAEPQHEPEPENEIELEDRIEPENRAELQKETVPEKGIDPANGAEPGYRIEPEKRAEPQNGAEPEDEIEPERRAEPQNETVPEKGIEPENEIEPEDEIEPESRAELQNETVPENEIELEDRIEPENRVEPQNEPEPGNGAEPENRIEPEKRAEPQNEPKPEKGIEPESGVEPEDEIEPENRAELQNETVPGKGIEPGNGAEPGDRIEPENRVEPQNETVPGKGIEPGNRAEPEKKEKASAIRAAEMAESCRKELGKRIIGQKDMLNSLLAALVAGGHILLEGVPGLAKTTAVKSLAEITGLGFKRIQFTPDLLPADLTGTLVWEQGTSSFSVRRGPVFANVILADEINRAPAKVQSALLEAMQERQVTIGEQSHRLPDPFFVLATQNPIEHEGTYPLPEAELDRFLLKILLTYPDPEEEIGILRQAAPIGAENPDRSIPLNPILGKEALASLRAAAELVRVDPGIERYMVAVAAATRPPENSLPGQRDYGKGKLRTPSPRHAAAQEGIYRYIAFGASPRGTIALHRLARIFALFEGRSWVLPEDVKAAAYPALRHRLVLSYEAEADGLDADTVLSRLLAFVPLP